MKAAPALSLSARGDIISQDFRDADRAVLFRLGPFSLRRSYMLTSFWPKDRRAHCQPTAIRSPAFFARWEKRTATTGECGSNLPPELQLFLTCYTE